MKKEIGKILNAGLSVFERDNLNMNCKGMANNHLTIVGGIRKVDFWPTTGTVYANGVKGKFRAFKEKKSSVEVAIKVAKEGRL